MKVQLIMPTINLWDKYAREAIASCEDAMMRAHARGVECRFLLIDNASSDATKLEAGKKVSNEFCHHRNEERWGFQKSVNYGVNDAFERGFDIALVLNNDIILHPEAIWRLAQRFEKGGVGMATCLDVSGEMKEKGIVAKDIAMLNANDKAGVDEAPHPCFSAFAVDKACWDEIGEFDEIFAPAYFEDNDYHYRMNLAELPAIVYPPAMFFHFASRTNAEAAEDGKPMISNGMFENNRAAYIKKWGGMPGKEIFKTPFNDPAKTVKSVLQCKE